MKLRLGQTWVSKEFPHESFKIYGGTIDTCVDSFKDENIPFDDQPEGTKIFFWERSDYSSFEKYIEAKFGAGKENTYPYANCGETKKSALVSKIKKYNMVLAKEDE